MKPAVVVLVLALAACTQHPTQSTQVVDDRPRVTFEPIKLRGKATEYDVVIDGIDYGPLSQFVNGKNALPIISGRHRIEVRSAGRTVFSEEVVLGENTTRVIRVIGND